MTGRGASRELRGVILCKSSAEVALELPADIEEEVTSIFTEHGFAQGVIRR